MPKKKKPEPVAAEVQKTKARRRKPVVNPVPVLAAPKTMVQPVFKSQWAEPKWIQRGMERGKLQKAFAAASKTNELYKYVQPAFGIMPTNLSQSFAFQASAWKNLAPFQSPAWKSFADAQRIFSRFDQIAWLSKSFPTEAELEARYEERKKATLRLARRGWFIPLEMTLGEHGTLFKKMAAHKEEEAEVFIEKHLEANLSEIEDELVKQAPERTAPLNEAFELHRKGKYFGSVALFLSLSDGIGYEIFQVSPVSSGKENLKKIRERIEPHRSKDFLIGWLWDAIGEVFPINDRTDNLHNYVEPLNRHAVLHGLRSDHGTKRHSLKAVSWLNHVSEFRN